MRSLMMGASGSSGEAIQSGRPSSAISRGAGASSTRGLRLRAMNSMSGRASRSSGRMRSGYWSQTTSATESTHTLPSATMERGWRPIRLKFSENCPKTNPTACSE